MITIEMMKRILFFIESLSGGGAEKVLVTLLKYLNIDKYDITLLTLVDVGELKDELNFNNIHYKTIIDGSGNLLAQLWNKVKYNLIYKYLPPKLVNRWIIPSGFDIYVAFVEGLSTKVLSYSQGGKIAWIHADLKRDPWTIKNNIYRNLDEERNAYKSYDKVVCVSRSVEEVMINYYGLKNTLTIYNPIDIEDIVIKSCEVIDIDLPKAFNIITVGRLVQQKGYDMLIPIISSLLKKNIAVSLYIIGEGPERKYLEYIIRKEKVADAVHLLGYKNNPYPIMKLMDLFVCSSRAEGYSLVIAEALILDLPVISMNCAGPSEILDGGKYGGVYNTYSELGSAIEKAVIEMSYYTDLKERASRRRSYFCISKTIYQIEKMIDSL